MLRAIAVGILVLAGGNPLAAEIKLIGSTGVRAVIGELAPQFEKASGHRVVTDFAVIAILKRRIEAGEAFDIVIPGPDLIAELVKQGKVAADANAPFARTGVALAVRAGAPRPDISTADKLRRVLLDAKAVGHSREGQSGVHFRAAIEKLGIAREMAPKLRPFDDGAAEQALQRGEIDLTAGGTGPILEMKAGQYIGGLPPEVQSYVRFSIGVSSGAKDPLAARELMRYLTSPAVAPAFKAKGLERD